ncbi:hypothetical protein QZJ86_01865 [Methylomonas montana]|nr:hypothetical protein [Methylomonas montana]WKJ92599.1 hypothetical protein QZJ86_01865 [Methylomonas montana]
MVTRYHYDSHNRLVRAETPNGTTQYRSGALPNTPRRAKPVFNTTASACWRKPITSAAVPICSNPVVSGPWRCTSKTTLKPTAPPTTTTWIISAPLGS